MTTKAPTPVVKTAARKHWALYKDGKRISRYHSTEDAAMVEAFEKKLVVQDKFGKYLANGYEVKNV